MKIEFSTDNAAFDNNSIPEIKRILDNIIKELNEGWSEGRILDINGNIIGHYKL